MVAAAIAVFFMTAAYGAAIYGSLTVDGEVPRAALKIELICGGRVIQASPVESGGSYRLIAPPGASDCNVRVGGASAAVVLYDNPKRYDFALTHTPQGQARLAQR